MTTPTKHRITTAEELLDMPDDGYRYELVRGELRKKVADWLAAGTRMVGDGVNPHNKTVKVHRSPTDVVALATTDSLNGGDVVPGWRMPLSDIFAD